MNRIVVGDKFMISLSLLAGDKFMPGMHSRQPGFTHSSCGALLRTKKK